MLGSTSADSLLLRAVRYCPASAGTSLYIHPTDKIPFSYSSFKKMGLDKVFIFFFTVQFVRHCGFSEAMYHQVVNQKDGYFNNTNIGVNII